MLKKLGKWNLLIFAVILGLILSLINFLVINPSKEYVSAGFVLLYTGAEKGEAPNGQPYSIDIIRSEGFLNEVIEKTGLSGSLTADELVKNMAVRGSYPSDIIDQIKSFDSLLISDPTRVVSVSDYNPTSFGISIYNEFSSKLSKTQLTALMSTLIEEYKVKYQKLYGAGVDWLSVEDLYAPGDRDYMQTVDLLTAKTDLIDKHAQYLYEVKQAFSNKGVTFLSIATRAQSIISSDLQSLSAMITLNALSKDSDALRQKYVYESDIQKRKLEALTSELAQVETLINSYDKDSTLYFSSGDNVITVEGKSRETYEALIDEKSRLSTGITEAQISIRDIQSRIDDLDATTEEGTFDVSVLEASIAAAEKKINDLINDFNDLAAAYNEEYASTSTIRSTEVRYHGKSVASTSFIKTVIKSEVPVCAVAILVILIIGLAGELKKSNKNKKRSTKSREAA